MIKDDIKEVLLSEEEIKKIVARLGKQITEDYKDKNLLMISILKGSVVFMSDLMRAVDTTCKIDFMCVSSYGSATRSSGNVKIIKDLDIDLHGYDVLLVEDILDSGNTLYYVRGLLAQRGAKSIRICTFLDKPSRRTADISADYVGSEIGDEFVVGYGLDFDEKYRNLPFLGVPQPFVYTGSEE